MGGRSMKDVGGAVLAGSTLALESVEESSAAVSKPRGVWLRMPVVKNLEEARRLPMRVEEQRKREKVGFIEKTAWRHRRSG